MADHDTISCDTFDDRVGELVLDLLEPAQRDALLLHAATCPRCQAQLQSLSTVADLLPTLAPECEPPLGFESRVLAAIAPRRTTTAQRILLAAACLVLVGGIGVWIGRSLDSGTAPVATAGPISGTLTADDGSEHGWVMLTGAPGPALTMHLSGLHRGTYRCVLEAADGTRTEVAAWPVDDTGGGQWTITFPTLPAAARIVVIDSGGGEVATADLQPAA